MAELRYNNQSGILGSSLTSASVGQSQTITDLFDVAPNFATIVGDDDYIKLSFDSGTGNFEIVYLTAYTSGSKDGTIKRGAEDATNWPPTSHTALTSTWGNNPSATDYATNGPLYLAPVLWVLLYSQVLGFGVDAYTYTSLGAGGVGDYITQNSPVHVLSIDGGYPAIGDRVFLCDSDGSGSLLASDIYDGIYVVTALGNGSSIPWVMTRSTDNDTADEIFTYWNVLVAENVTGTQFGFGSRVNVSSFASSPVVGATPIYTNLADEASVALGTSLVFSGTGVAIDGAVVLGTPGSQSGGAALPDIVVTGTADISDTLTVGALTTFHQGIQLTGQTLLQYDGISSTPVTLTGSEGPVYLCQGGAASVALPLSEVFVDPNLMLWIKNTTSTSVTLLTQSGDTIDGFSSLELLQNQAVQLYADGIGHWYTLSTTGISTGAVTTAPTDSHTATTAFGSLALGTPKQSPLEYDVIATISVPISAAVGGSVAAGVGPTSTPTTDPISPALSAATVITFSQYVPADYYLSVTTSGTITAGTPVVQITPA